MNSRTPIRLLAAACLTLLPLGSDATLAASTTHRASPTPQPLLQPFASLPSDAFQDPHDRRHATKPSAALSLSLIPRAELTVPGAAATADLRLRPTVDLASAEVTLAASGPVAVVGSPTRSLGAISAGAESALPVTYAVTGDGEGTLRATITGRRRDGAPIGQQTIVVYVLGAAEEVLHGRSGPLDLRLARLDRQYAAQRLDATAYAQAVAATRGGGATEAASHTRSGRTITVTGRVAWTDRIGRTHPVRLATVEIRDAQLGGPPLVTTTTDTDGRYSVSLTNTGPGGRDVLVRVYAQAPGFTVRSQRGAVHRIQSSLHQDVPSGTVLTVNLTANNTLDNNTAFSVHDALVTAGHYLQRVHGAPLPDVDVVFPAFGTFYTGTQIHVLQLDRFDWDVILHEYGHHAAENLGIADSPGGFHGPGNLGEGFGKDGGIRLAWSEGWATYFGTTAQQVMGAASLGIPFVGDSRYTDTEDFDFDYDLETQTGGFASFPSFVILSLGEDDEISVQRILWDLFDAADDLGDAGLALGDTTIWKALDSANAVTLSAAHGALTAGRPVQQLARVGCAFGEHRVAPAPAAPGDARALTPRPLTFSWQPNGGGPSHRNDRFVVEIYDASFGTLLFASPEQSAASWTPTQTQWDTIRERAAGQTTHWLVRGRQTDDPLSGPYRSCARSLAPAPGS